MSELAVFRETDMYSLYRLAVDSKLPLEIRYDIAKQMLRQQMYNRIYSTRMQERRQAKKESEAAAKLIIFRTKRRRREKRYGHG